MWLLVIALVWPVAISAGPQSTLFVKGRVVDLEDRPVPGVEVAVEAQGGRRIRVAVKTNEHGDFGAQFGLFPGVYRVTAAKDGYTETSLLVRVEMGEPTTVRLRIARSRAARVDAPSRPIRVHVRAASAPSHGEGADAKSREDSVRDLAAAIEEHVGLALTSSADESDLIVEVVSRRIEQTPVEATQKAYTVPSIGGLSDTSRQASNRIDMTLVAGTRSEPLTSRFGPASWREAARLAATQIDEWAARNKAALLAGR